MGVDGIKVKMKEEMEITRKIKNNSKRRETFRKKDEKRRE
jgi:hypothetical protein